MSQTANHDIGPYLRSSIHQFCVSWRHWAAFSRLRLITRSADLNVDNAQLASPPSVSPRSHPLFEQARTSLRLSRADRQRHGLSMSWPSVHRTPAPAIFCTRGAAFTVFPPFCLRGLPTYPDVCIQSSRFLRPSRVPPQDAPVDHTLLLSLRPYEQFFRTQVCFPYHQLCPNAWAHSGYFMLIAPTAKR